MAERQEYPNPAVGSASERRPAAVRPPRGPTLDDDGRLLLEPGEAGIGSLPASGVRFRSRYGSVEQRWGPLDMSVTLTTHRVVLIASSGRPAGTWPSTGSVPLALRAIEPTQSLRRHAPVRIAGHVRWSSVTRVESDRGRIHVTMPAWHDAEASLAFRVPGQLGDRFLGIARAAFVTAKRQLTVDEPNRIEAIATIAAPA